MKSRKFTFIGISGILILLFIVLVLIGHTQTDTPVFSKSQETISKLFPNSKITWSKEIDAEFVNFKATSTSIAISTKNDGKKSLEYINFEKGISWEIDSQKFSYKYYYLVGGAEQRILAENPKHESLVETNVFDQAGKYLFQVRTISTLQASPNGRYYHTVGSMTSYNRLKLFDAEGQLLWSREISGMDWFAKALSDSELICEGSAGCYLLDAFSGEEIWKISRNQYKHVLPGYKLKHIHPSSNGKHFVLFHGDGIVSLDRRGKILWLKGIPGTVLFVTISDDGRFVSVYSKERRDGKESKLALLDNLDQGKIIWSRPIKTEKKDGTSNIGGLEIAGDFVRLIPGIVQYRVQTGITSDMQTFCFQIDPENGELLNQYTIDGVLELLKTEKKKIYYLLVHKRDKKEIFRIEQVTDK